MVQIIEENVRPSRSQLIGRSLAGLANTGMQFLGAREQKKQQLQKLQQENETVKKLVGYDISGIQDPKVRQKAIEVALQGQQKEQEHKFAMERDSQKQMDEFNRAQELQRQKYQFEQELQGKKLAGESQQEAKEKKEITDRAQSSFNAMAELLNKGNLGLGSGIKGTIFGGETARDTGKFQSASGGLEAILVDMVSRGTLSNARFQYITETLLPKPTDRDETIRGKLEALAELLGLDSSALTGKGITKSSSKSKEKQSLQDIFG